MSYIVEKFKVAQILERLKEGGIQVLARLISSPKHLNPSSVINFELAMRESPARGNHQD